MEITLTNTNNLSNIVKQGKGMQVMSMIVCKQRLQPPRTPSLRTVAWATRKFSNSQLEELDGVAGEGYLLRLPAEPLQ